MLCEKMDEAKDSLIDTGNKNQLDISCLTSSYPIKVVITRRPDEQQSLYDDNDLQSNGVDSKIVLTFADELEIFISQNFTISDDLLSSLRNKAKKWHYLYLQYWYELKMTADLLGDQ